MLTLSSSLYSLSGSHQAFLRLLVSSVASSPLSLLPVSLRLLASFFSCLLLSLFSRAAFVFRSTLSLSFPYLLSLLFPLLFSAVVSFPSSRFLLAWRVFFLSFFVLVALVRICLLCLMFNKFLASLSLLFLFLSFSIFQFSSWHRVFFFPSRSCCPCCFLIHKSFVISVKQC